MCSSGTTAFPSERWKGGNGPKETDLEGTTNLVRACAGRPGLGRFVLVTSCGVERYKVLGPFMILNAFGGEERRAAVTSMLCASRMTLASSTLLVTAVLGLLAVLEYKKRSEEALVASGIPYTIIRPSRLTDGPYTSYDLNTLLRATSGSNQRVQLSARDDLGRGQCSRIAVAEACVQALSGPETEGKVLAMETVVRQWRASLSQPGSRMPYYTPCLLLASVSQSAGGQWPGERPGPVAGSLSNGIGLKVSCIVHTGGRVRRKPPRSVVHGVSSRQGMPGTRKRWKAIGTLCDAMTAPLATV